MLSVGSFFGRGFDSHRLHHFEYNRIKTYTVQNGHFAILVAFFYRDFRLLSP